MKVTKERTHIFGRNPAHARARNYNSAFKRFKQAIELSAAALILLGLASFVFAGTPQTTSSAKPVDVTTSLKSLKTWDRLQAAENIVSRRGIASNTDIIAAISSEKNIQVRYTLLEALAEAYPQDALPVLIDALSNDDSPAVRVMAAQGIGRRMDEDGTKALIDCLSEDIDVEVRKACAVGLGFRRSADARAALIDAASDPDADIRKYAALGLAHHPKGPEVDRALDLLGQDSDREVAEKARLWKRNRKP